MKYMDMISRKRDHSEGSKAVWKFSKNSSVLVPSFVPLTSMTTRAPTVQVRQRFESVSCFDFSQYIV